jgi:hypothetical protein
MGGWVNPCTHGLVHGCVGGWQVSIAVGQLFNSDFNFLILIL